MAQVENRKVVDWIDGFCTYLDNSEPPYMYKLWCGISVIAAALQRKCFLEWGTLTFYPNMYVVLVGPSGVRKGTTMDPAASFLYDLNIKLAAEAITREALIRELSEATAADPNPELGIIGAQHSSLTIFAQEFTVFIGYNNSSLLSDLTDWYDCRRRWTYRTKNMGTDEIIGVFVNLIGATTPELVRTMLPMDAIGGGLTSRMIFVYEEKKGKTVIIPFLTDEERQLRAHLLEDLQRIHQLNGKFRITQGFIDLWTEWYPAQDANPPFTDNRFSGYIMRRPNHIMKLSMICSASRSSSMIITKEDLERAIKILAATERKMPYTFSGVGKYRHAETLEDVMKEIGIRGTTSKRELQILFRRDASSQELDEMIQALETMGYIKLTREVPSGEMKIEYIKGGRPS